MVPGRVSNTALSQREDDNSYVSLMPGQDSNKEPPQREADTSQLRQPALSKRSITIDISIEVYREKKAY